MFGSNQKIKSIYNFADKTKTLHLEWHALRLGARDGAALLEEDDEALDGLVDAALGDEHEGGVEGRLEELGAEAGVEACALAVIGWYKRRGTHVAVERVWSVLMELLALRRQTACLGRLEPNRNRDERTVLSLGPNTRARRSRSSKPSCNSARPQVHVPIPETR